MKRVLVTGASGFIGRHTLASLRDKGYETHAVTRREGVWQPDVHWHHADLLAEADVTRLLKEVQPTHLLHFSWEVTPGTYWTSPANFAWVQASLHLLRTFHAQGGQRIVMAGSCAEYDWSHGFCSEFQTPSSTTTPYNLCKQALQQMLASYSANTGLSSAWGRIFFVYGPHEHQARLVPSVIRQLLRGEPARCSHGKQVRDFLHVSDVADAFVALLDSDVQGPVNMASGKPIALREIIDTAAELIGRPDLIEYGAIQVPADDPPLVVADVRRLEREVGFQPRFELRAGIRHTLEWWKDEIKRGLR